MKPLCTILGVLALAASARAQTGGSLPTAAAKGEVPVSTGAGTAYAAVAQSPPSVVTYGADPTGATDSTSAFNAALAANPSGSIYAPVGTYKISSPLIFGLNSYLRGSSGGGTVLNCTMTGAPCVVFAAAAVANSISGMSDLLLSGPGSGYATAGGIFLGGDPAGLISPSADYGEGASFSNVVLYNFGYCVRWGNNAWLNGFHGGGMANCAIGFDAPSGTSNSGENIHISDYYIANGGTPIVNQGFEFNIESTSFDYNSSYSTINSGAFHITRSHFEQKSGAFIQVPFGSPIVNITQSTMLLQAGTGTDTDFLDLYPTTMQLVLDSVNVYSNHSVSEFVHTGGASSTNGSITNISGGLNVSLLVQAGQSNPNLVVQGFNSAPVSAGTFSSLTDSGLTGLTQCLQINSSGVISGTGAPCGSGSGSGGSTGSGGGGSTPSYVASAVSSTASLNSPAIPSITYTPSASGHALYYFYEDVGGGALTVSLTDSTGSPTSIGCATWLGYPGLGGGNYCLWELSSASTSAHTISLGVSGKGSAFPILYVVEVTNSSGAGGHSNSSGSSLPGSPLPCGSLTTTTTGMVLNFGIIADLSAIVAAGSGPPSFTAATPFGTGFYFAGIGYSGGISAQTYPITSGFTYTGANPADAYLCYATEVKP